MANEVTRVRGLPTGTVSLLFADVEGSTRLLNLLGERYGSVRARSRGLVRDAVQAHRGYEVDWAGDGVFLAFERAGDAIAAAADIQRALAHEPWMPDEGIRLRIGIHTGEPDLDDEGYVGIDVVVAARICAAAHGGQVVVSAATRQLFDAEPETELSLRPLGSFRLKDIREPQELFQLVGPELADAFPPLATLGGGALPTLHHRLVGRAVQLAEIQSLLARADVRLVTITGAGGAGKSRLALEVASRQLGQRPVQLVGLASISDAELVPAAIARALGLRDSPSEPLLDSIATALRGTHALLYLDNLEHLPAAGEYVRTLVDAVPDLVVLATSRTPLRLSGERILALDPLTTDEAVELFVELTEARSLRLPEDQLPTVRAICQRVDCLPLAIELVAARLAVLSAGQLLDALGPGVTLDLEGAVDLPARQRTLRATLDWSYELLTPSQRSLHGALAVFAGGCSLEEARAVSGNPERFLSDLETLVLGSLVRGDAGGGETRLVLLETVREHALDRLRAEKRLDELRRQHAECFLELALTAEDDLAGPEQGRWLDRLEVELDNLRLALDWLLSAGRTVDALRAVSALGRFWRARGHVTEARRWLSAALAQADDVPPELLATALWWSARQAAAQDDLSAEIPLLEHALALFRELSMPQKTAFVLGELGWIALQQGDETKAEELCSEALEIARSTGDPDTISGQLNYLADIYSARGDHAAALAAHEEALALRKTLNDPLLVTNSTYNLGLAAWENGEIDRARTTFEETHRLAESLGDVLHLTAAEFMLAQLDLRDGDLDEAERRILRCYSVYTELGSARSRAESLVVLAGVIAERDRAEEATRLFGAANALRGDSPLNRFDAPVLALYLPKLEAGLGTESVAQLLEEGARVPPEVLVPELVSSDTRN